jgi:hypothetical protein
MWSDPDFGNDEPSATIAVSIGAGSSTGEPTWFKIGWGKSGFNVVADAAIMMCRAFASLLGDRT